MKIFFLIIVLALIANEGLSQRQRKGRPKHKDVQQSFGNVFSFVDGESYANATTHHDNEIKALGLNTTLSEPYYAALKQLRRGLLKRGRGNNSENKQLGKRAEKLIEAGEDFLDSQKGLKNFKTDQTKKDDPFLGEFYEYHNKFVKDVKRTIDEPEYADTYFKVQGDFFGNFTIVLSKIIQRATENAVEITTIKTEQ